MNHSLLNGPNPATVPMPGAVNGTLVPATAKSKYQSGDEAKVIDDKAGPILSDTEEPLYKTKVKGLDAATDTDGSGKATSRETKSFEDEPGALTPNKAGRIFESESQQWDGDIDADEAVKPPTRKHPSPAVDVQSNPEMSKRQLVMENIGTGSPSKTGNNTSILYGSTDANIKMPAQDSVLKEQKVNIPPQTQQIEKAECEPQGLASPPRVIMEKFGLGGEADSIYEYLPKQHLLLGGLKSQYRTMYERAIEAANKYLLFRPMLPDARDILVLGTASLAENPDVPGNLRLYPEQQHLLCFSGGMYAMGSKIFDRKADLEIAAKLTDGCVWAYESTVTGIMPEGFTMMACDNIDTCEWNQTRWNDSLDPNPAYREQNLRSTQQALLIAQQQQPSPAQIPEETDSMFDTDLADKEVTPQVESDLIAPISKPLAKRQLESFENDFPTIRTKTTQVSNQTHKPSQTLVDNADTTIRQESETETEEDAATPLDTLTPSPTREEYVESRRKVLRLPVGVTTITSSKYILRSGQSQIHTRNRRLTTWCTQTRGHRVRLHHVQNHRQRSLARKRLENVPSHPAVYPGRVWQFRAQRRHKGRSDVPG